MLQALEQSFPCRPRWQLQWHRLTPCSLWKKYPPSAWGGPHTRAGGHASKKAAAHGEPMQEQHPWPRLCSTETSLCRCWFSGKTCDPVRDLCWNSPFLKDCTPWKGLMLAHSFKNYSPWEGSPVEQFVKDYIPWEGPRDRVGEQRDEKGEAEMKWYGLTIIPKPHPPATFGDGRVARKSQDWS